MPTNEVFVDVFCYGNTLYGTALHTIEKTLQHTLLPFSLLMIDELIDF